MKLSESAPEGIDVTEVLELAAKLGMGETPEMTALRGQIVEALREGPEKDALARELYAEYERKVDMLLEKVTTLNGQIGEQLVKAVIFGEAGNGDYFLDFLSDARLSAHNSGLMWEEVNQIGGIMRRSGLGG